MASANAELVAHVASLEAKLAEQTALIEQHTHVGNALRAERERRARKERNARVNALPVADYIAELSAARPVDRPSYHTPPSAAIRMAREADAPTRAKLLALLTDSNAAEVAFALYAPPTRSVLYIPAGKEREVRMRDVRLTPEQAEQAEAVGLTVEWYRVANTLDEQPHIPGIEYHDVVGMQRVYPRAALALFRELAPTLRELIRRESVLARDLSDDESREIDRRAWFDAGARRDNLPALG